MRIINFVRKYKYIGELIVILGTGFFSFGVFSFSFTDRIKVGISLPALPSFGGRELGHVAYFYSPASLFFIVSGAMLVISGILVIKNRN